MTAARALRMTGARCRRLCWGLGSRLCAGLGMGVAMIVALAIVACPDAALAQGERLVLSISQPEVRITSSFDGAELVVFGVAPDGGEFDVVVTVRGPAEEFVTWRKTRMAGIWINTDSRRFLEVPAFLSVQSNRPMAGIAGADILRSEQVGLTRNVLVQRVGTDFSDVVPSDPFRVAFLRIRQADGLYRENEAGVTFLAPDVFRSDFAIPGVAPIGRYTVNAKLFRNGRMTAHASTEFTVKKTGFEQNVAQFSQEHGLLYGLLVALGSLLIGLGANILFRRE